MSYKSLLRPLLFALDSERVHELMLHAGALPGARHIARYGLGPRVTPELAKILAVSAFGLHFPNPICLAAGFDKNADIVPLLEEVGFGGIELGTVTALPQPGNPRPRIFRFPDDAALINRMGFPSRGAEVVARKLAVLGAATSGVIRGINIGKSKATPIDEAAEDYCRSMKLLAPLADYVTINISSPNTPELRKLQEKDRLAELIARIQGENILQRPLLIKIAPDLTWPEIDDVLACCEGAKVSGIIATNTTFSRVGLSASTSEIGGLSGRPLKPRALEVVRYVYQQTRGQLPIVGVGGIFGANDVLEFMSAGAQLVQLYTGLIYEGPAVVNRMCRMLTSWCQSRGLDNITQLVGSNEKITP